MTDGGNNLYIDDLYVGDGGIVTATDELQSGMGSVRFFPNPARDYVQFLIPPGLNTPVHIRAYDTPGKLLRDYGEYASNASPILDLAGLPPGFLFFTLQFIGLSYTTRVAKLP